jgi:ribosomal protein L27
MADRRAANRLSAQSSRDAKRQRLGEEEYVKGQSVSGGRLDTLSQQQG